MKYLKTYRLFESDDLEYERDSEVGIGFKHAWNDVKERLLYLTDLGFEMIDGSKKEYLLDDNDNKVVTQSYHRYYNLTDAKSAVLEFAMIKRRNEDDVIVKREIDRGMRNYDTFYHTRWDDKVNEVNEAIASFVEHFDNCLYNLTLTDKGWIVRFIVRDDADFESITKTDTDTKKYKARERILNSLHRLHDSIESQVTKSFKKAIGGLVGTAKSGFIMVPINTDGIRRQVINQNMPRVEKVGVGWYITELKKEEFREITEKDIQRLIDGDDDGYYVDMEKLKKKYLGKKAHIIEFDYDGWLKFYLD